MKILIYYLTITGYICFKIFDNGLKYDNNKFFIEALDRDKIQKITGNTPIMMKIN